MENNPISNNSSAEVEVSNIGGIDHASVSLEPGLTTLAGENATNRSSFLLALNEVLGGTMGNIRRGSNQKAFTELELNGQTYTRTLKQAGQTGRIQRDGQPYCSKESSLINLYATLVKENKIRKLVETGSKTEIDEQLADLLMAPVDTDKIGAEIEQQQNRLRTVREQISDIESAKDSLPELKDRRDDLVETRNSLEERVDSTHAELADVNLDENAAEEAQKLLSKLQTTREERHNLESTIQRKQRALRDLQGELTDRQEELGAVEEDLEELSPPSNRQIETVEERKRQLTRVASSLDGFADACRVLVEDTDVTLPDEVDIDITNIGDPTAALMPDEAEIRCPACGSASDRSQIESRIQELQSAAAECDRKAGELNSRREELQSQQEKREQLEEKCETLQNEIRRIEHRIEEKKQRIEELEAELESKEDTIESLQAEIEKAEARRNDEFERLHDQLSDLQSEHAEVSAEIDLVVEKINRQESQLEDEDDLIAEKATLKDQIEQKRGRVNKLEQQVQEDVSDHVDELVDRLEYPHIEGARIIRKPTDVPHEISKFELVVTRRKQDGTIVEEEDITTLSESERSLLGLAVAISGNAAHKVTEDVPFLMLDSIEQFDSRRIDRLTDYVRSKMDVSYIVTALLPEDKNRLTGDRHEIPAEMLG